MISIESTGSFDNTEKWLKNVSDASIFSVLSHYGSVGVDALASATPIDSSLTANSWSYEVIQDATSWSIVWNNTNVVNGTPVAILLQYGHGTGTGGYVEGYDYINPALKPIFDQMVADGIKVVNSA